MKLFFFILSFHICTVAKPISITAFGGVGDGVFDNYYVFKQAAIYAAANPNTTITFPAGTFYIAKYRTVKNDTTDHITWANCIGLKLIGTTGTIISVNGAFFRGLNYLTVDCSKKSYTTGLSPFFFYRCRNLEIRNMEITGNVQNTTRAPGYDINNPSVTESNNILLRFTKCDTVIIDNMYLHHAEVDGIAIDGERISGVWTNSTAFTVSNVRCWYNARLGMSVGGLTNGYFYKCSFNYTGFDNGTYGQNDPAAGVDMEPGAHYIDQVTFDSCYFEGNYGNQFITSYPATSSNVTLLKCVLRVPATGKIQALTILARFTLIDSCFISIGIRDIKITNPAYPGSTIGIRHTTIETTDVAMNSVSASMADSVEISNSTFIFLPLKMTKTFLQLTVTKLRFLNNTVYASPAAIASRPTAFHVLIRNAIISSGNTFASGMRVDYTGTQTVADP